ncbi:hypothetical protein CKM354_001234900 [Cercospora kikuchii]|uniref:Fungal N-terminal domain-containing protein n=1 Tax=Cercospora kikuchii TaxID=84275 RepID=A0A9P3L2J6_9PEZI|nr:uncharacterized protein CKM354_001234900 [Cercospora kikuchii]GIZ49317.1 hypothetical protein CKM354_001234900 [Cercospora kikuchii]
MLDPLTATAVTGFGAAAASTLKTVEKVFEFIAVDQAATDLLETTRQINTQLEYGRTLRRQKSMHLSKDEKHMIDTTFDATEKAVYGVACLIEPARVDMQVSGGEVSFPTRMQFVFRHTAQIPVSLAKLGIAGSSLNMVISLLSSKESSSAAVRNSSQRDTHSPPTYQESQWLHASRQKILRRRASAIAERVTPTSGSNRTSSYANSIAELPNETISVNRERMVENDFAGLIPIELYGTSERPGGVTPLVESNGRLTGVARSRSWLGYHLHPR